MKNIFDVKDKSDIPQEIFARIKYGSTKDMTDEEYRQYKRNLQKRWRLRHPEFVKAQNKHYSEIYSRTRPYTCICKICGKEFGVTRKNNGTYCPDCWAEKKRIAEMKKKAVEIKRAEHKEEVFRICELYKSGMTQQEIAKIFERSQSGVSQIIRKHLQK